MAQDAPQDAHACRELRRELDAQIAGQSASGYVYPRTALKAVRMLTQLHATGFASFA